MSCLLVAFVLPCSTDFCLQMQCATDLTRKWSGMCLAAVNKTPPRGKCTMVAHCHLWGTNSQSQTLLCGNTVGFKRRKRTWPRGAKTDAARIGWPWRLLLHMMLTCTFGEDQMHRLQPRENTSCLFSPSSLSFFPLEMLSPDFKRRRCMVAIPQIIQGGWTK